MLALFFLFGTVPDFNASLLDKNQGLVRCETNGAHFAIRGDAEVFALRICLPDDDCPFAVGRCEIGSFRRVPERRCRGERKMI